MSIKPSDWSEHKLLVMTTLDRVETKVDHILVEQSKIKTEIAVLKVKAGLWGSLSGLVVAMTVKFFSKGTL